MTPGFRGQTWEVTSPSLQMEGSILGMFPVALRAALGNGLRSTLSFLSTTAYFSCAVLFTAEGLSLFSSEPFLWQQALCISLPVIAPCIMNYAGKGPLHVEG